MHGLRGIGRPAPRRTNPTLIPHRHRNQKNLQNKLHVCTCSNLNICAVQLVFRMCQIPHEIAGRPSGIRLANAVRKRNRECISASRFVCLFQRFGSTLVRCHGDFLSHATSIERAGLDRHRAPLHTTEKHHERFSSLRTGPRGRTPPSPSDTRAGLTDAAEPARDRGAWLPCYVS